MYATLEHDASKGSSETKGLFTRIKCVTFVLLTCFLLPVVTKLSQAFQKDLIDVETVNVMVEDTSMKFDQLKNKKWTRVGERL